MREATMTSNLKDSISDASAAVGESLHTGRVAAASALHDVAKGIHTKADRVGTVGHDAVDTVTQVADDAADKVEAASKYVRSHGAKQLMADVSQFVKKNPGKSLAAAALLGFFAARMLRRAE